MEIEQAKYAWLIVVLLWNFTSTWNLQLLRLLSHLLLSNQSRRILAVRQDQSSSDELAVASLACPWYHSSSLNRNSRPRVARELPQSKYGFKIDPVQLNRHSWDRNQQSLVTSRLQRGVTWGVTNEQGARIAAYSLCWLHCDWLQWQAYPSPSKFTFGWTQSVLRTADHDHSPWMIWSFYQDRVFDMIECQAPMDPGSVRTSSGLWDLLVPAHVVRAMVSNFVVESCDYVHTNGRKWECCVGASCSSQILGPAIAFVEYASAGYDHRYLGGFHYDLRSVCQLSKVGLWHHGQLWQIKFESLPWDKSVVGWPVCHQCLSPSSS